MQHNFISKAGVEWGAEEVRIVVAVSVEVAMLEVEDMQVVEAMEEDKVIK